VGLRPLRDEGVLVLGSGDVVHNLHTYAWGRHPVEPYDWALRFEQVIRTAIEENDHQTVVAYEELGRDRRSQRPRRRTISCRSSTCWRWEGAKEPVT